MRFFSSSVGCFLTIRVICIVDQVFFYFVGGCWVKSVGQFSETYHFNAMAATGSSALILALFLLQLLHLAQFGVALTVPGDVEALKAIKEVDVPSGLRMSQSEENEEQSAELSGGPAEPSLASSWTVLSEDIHALSSSGLSDPYQNYKQAEMFESFVPTSYQFKKAINAGDVGTMGIIRDVFQTTKLTGRKNEVAVPSSGFSVEEVRVSHPL